MEKPLFQRCFLFLINRVKFHNFLQHPWQQQHQHHQQHHHSALAWPWHRLIEKYWSRAEFFLFVCFFFYFLCPQRYLNFESCSTFFPQTPTLLLTPSPLLSNIHFWSTLSPVAPISPATRRQGGHLFQVNITNHPFLHIYSHLMCLTVFHLSISPLL